jgi:hypothetical protein
LVTRAALKGWRTCAGTPTAQSLPRRSLLLYAVKIRVDSGDIAFVRKSNPRTVAKPGRMFALLGDTLARIGPVLGLDDFSLKEGCGVIVLRGSRGELPPITGS